MLRKVSMLVAACLWIAASVPHQADAVPARPPNENGFYSGRNAVTIYRRGLAQGNRAGVFSKVGDSITASPLFLVMVGNGGLHLGEHEYLRPTMDYFLKDFNSFTNTSLAAQSGWTTLDLLTPGRRSAIPNVRRCAPEETPLVCEYRVTKPTLALIMIGTNDILRDYDIGPYETHLRQIVQTSIDMGVLPILSTLPDIRNGNQLHAGRVLEFNGVIWRVAHDFGVPLWDYWYAMQGLPGLGLESDGIHPSYPPSRETAIFTPDLLIYGYNMRNLTALQIL